jgi:phage terminase large subunit GpA-like protein
MDPGKWPALAITMGMIDCRYDTSAVYELVDSWQDVDLRPVLGRDFMAGASKLDGQAIRKNRRTGRAFRRVIFRWGFENLHWKNVAARLAQNATPGPGYMHLPADIPDVWFSQFTSEKLVPDRSRGKRGRSGRPMRIWKTSYEGAANHYWDCAVINTLATDEQLLNLRRLPDPTAPPPAEQTRKVLRMDRFSGR